ncbi:MAG: hypothetical protein ABI824_20365 [Acidobacteriota bacterium]
MIKRHATGGVTKQRRSWREHWYKNGVKKSRVLGLIAEVTKGEAREAVAEIVAAQRNSSEATTLAISSNVGSSLPTSEKWKPSTAAENKQRINYHLVSIYKDRELASFRRYELQGLIDAGGKSLFLQCLRPFAPRRDCRPILQMAVAEG